MPTITADFEYIIDDSVADGTLLPVEITNMFFDKRELDFFSTHNTPFSTHNRWNMVGTSTVPLEYEGNGIVNRDYSTGHPNGEAITNPNGGPWIFDAYHTVDIRGKNIPEGARTGAYAGRTNFVANERFDEEWVHNLVTVPHDDAWLLQNDYAAFTDRYNIFHEMETSADVTGRTQDNPSVNPGYGLFNQFKVKIHNAGEQDRTFSYLVQGQKYTVNWESVDIQTGERQSGYSDVDIDDISDKLQIDAFTLSVFQIPIKAGHTVELTINGTIICGVNPTYHHAFAISANDKLTELYQENNDGTRQYLCTKYNGNLMEAGSVNAILQSREVE